MHCGVLYIFLENAITSNYKRFIICKRIKSFFNKHDFLQCDFLKASLNLLKKGTYYLPLFRMCKVNRFVRN